MTDRLSRPSCQQAYDAFYARLFKGGFQDATLPLDFDRIYFYLELLAATGLLRPGIRLLDLGGGLSIFAPLLTHYGLKVTIVDDFGGGGGVRIDAAAEDLKILRVFQEELGIAILALDFLEQAIPLPDATFDVVTCFHSLEHWHHSPKRLFSDLSRLLHSKGFLILATPNAVNIRKRVFVLLGRSNLPRLEEWYNEPVFRGHVREPTLQDLRRLLEWNDFRVVAQGGRNFIGRRSTSLSFLPASVLRRIAATADRFLPFFPTLWSDIHVVGRKKE